jgi:AcrR family transcriptional regulator
MRAKQSRVAAVVTDTRSRVVVAARRHFLAHGFRGVTMDDLALELGMSKKTLYQQFSSKEKLVEAVLADKFREMDAAFRQITACCADDFLGALHRLLGTLQRQASEIQPPFVRDIQRSAPELFQIVENRRTELIRRHFGTLFAEGRRAGMIRTDIPARVAIAILLGAVQSVVNPQMIGELNITPQAGVSAVITVVLEGLVTRKRRGKK